MKFKLIFCIGVVIIVATECKNGTMPDDRYRNASLITDTLPEVLAMGHADLIGSKLRHEALMKFSLQQLPDNLEEWESHSNKLRDEILKKTGAEIDHALPVNLKITGTIPGKSYEIQNILFQTRPGIYATATLFVPEGKAPFPAVIVLCGHSLNGRLAGNYQSVGTTLALNGYVALVMDPWGAGERTTTHGIFEYHGGNLGASLLDIGESLMGMQISDNIRGVDLLCSLPYVDPQNIGATGGSGGGNQTMWLAATDVRIKAAVPVVSVGTFEAYVMRSNCVCEDLPGGLTFTEESGVLALAKAIMPCNHIKDTNQAFFPSELLRSYHNAIPVYKLTGREKNLNYKIFDLPHGYFPQDREAMLGWFDLHLKGKGTGDPEKEIPFELIPEEKLMVFPLGQRDADVVSTDEYCRQKGNELRAKMLNITSFGKDQKVKELKEILGSEVKSDLRKIHQFSTINGWDRLALETSDDKLIPVLHLSPLNKSKDYIILCNPAGKDSISQNLINEFVKKGSGIVIVDLTGTGEHSHDRRVITPQSKGDATTVLSRAELWLGRTLMGEWINDLNVVNQFLDTKYKHGSISIEGSKEAGIAALFSCLLGGKADNIILTDSPVSYLFDNRESVNYFKTAIHVPGILNWGDISLAAALSGKNITFINPVSMSGQKVRGRDWMVTGKNLRT